MFGLSYNKGQYPGTAYVLSSALSVDELDSVASGALSLAQDERTLLTSSAVLELKEIAPGRYASSVTGSGSVATAKPSRSGKPEAVVMALAGNKAVQLTSDELDVSHAYLSRHDSGVTFSFTFVEYFQ